MSDLDKEFVEEAPDTGDPYARQSKAWTEGIAKKEMEAFAADVAANARSAESSATKAVQAAAATASDVARTAQSVKDAKQHAETAAAQVPLAQSAAGQASNHATVAKGHAQAAAGSAKSAKDEADRAKRIVDEFNPWINQYGYSKVVMVTTNLYYVKAEDVGKTLVFDREATVVLPAAGRAAFPESFFFHVTTLDPEHSLWIDYDLAISMTMPVDLSPIVQGGYRGTIQLLQPGHWRLYDILPDQDFQRMLVLSKLSLPGQSRGMTRLRDYLDASKRHGLVKQYGKLYAWGLDLLGGNSASASFDAVKVNDLPDGPLEFVYNSRSQFNGNVLFGVYGTPALGVTNLGWYWGDAGFTGNVYPVTIEGYLPADWYVTSWHGEFSTGSKHAWVELTSRSLTEANGKPTVKHLLLTSTDGFSWFENRFSQLNEKIGKRKIIANFPFTILDTGELYLVELNGEIKKVEYGITTLKWVETKVADSCDEVINRKAWSSNGDYALAFKSGGNIHMFVHSATLDKTVENHDLTGIENAIAPVGDLVRGVLLVTRERGSTELYTQEFGLDENYPDGELVTLQYYHDFEGTPIPTMVGTVVAGVDNTVEYLAGYDEETKVSWISLDRQFYELPWKTMTPFGVGGITNKAGREVPGVFTHLGVLTDYGEWDIGDDDLPS